MGNFMLEVHRAPSLLELARRLDRLFSFPVRRRLLDVPSSPTPLFDSPSSRRRLVPTVELEAASTVSWLASSADYDSPRRLVRLAFRHRLFTGRDTAPTISSMLCNYGHSSNWKGVEAEAGNKLYTTKRRPNIRTQTRLILRRTFLSACTRTVRVIISCNLRLSGATVRT